MPDYDPRKVEAHGSDSAKIYLMNEAPGPREADSGCPLFGDQGGNLYRALRRAKVSWAIEFDFFPWPKFSNLHYKDRVGKRNVELRKRFLEIRRNYITCSNAFDRWPKPSENSEKCIAPGVSEVKSEENVRRISGEITSKHEILLICGISAWRAVFHQYLDKAKEQIGRRLTKVELKKANEKLGANFIKAFYMGHTTQWRKHREKIDAVLDSIRPYLER